MLLEHTEPDEETKASLSKLAGSFNKGWKAANHYLITHLAQLLLEMRRSA